jgi:hypothetical protein
MPVFYCALAIIFFVALWAGMPEQRSKVLVTLGVIVGFALLVSVADGERSRSALLFITGLSVVVVWLLWRITGFFARGANATQAVVVPREVREAARDLPDGLVTFFLDQNGEPVYGQILNGEFFPVEVERIDDEEPGEEPEEVEEEPAPQPPPQRRAQAAPRRAQGGKRSWQQPGREDEGKAGDTGEEKK